MHQKLLSIVVPTRNRVEYLKSFILLIESFNNEDIELVIQDNSDDNSEIKKFIAEKKFPFIVYNYDNSKMSIAMNSDLAVQASNGKYICFMGDDDLLSKDLYKFVYNMNHYGYESATFQSAKYYWPGIKFKAHKFPNLVIPRFKGIIKSIDVETEYYSLLERGATSLENMPKLYQGIVTRQCLEKVFSIAGTYFPGASPDMANCVALSKVVTKHVYCDIPLITSGASPKSGAGLGTKHKHNGNLKDMDFLPVDIEKRWNDLIPKVWTGLTIYAESMFEAMKAVGLDNDKKYFNYNYFYAAFYVFHPEHRELLKKTKSKNSAFNKLFFSINIYKVFTLRVRQYLLNLLLLKFHFGAELRDNVNNSLEAAIIIDEYTAGINIERMFTKVIRS